MITHSSKVSHEISKYDKMNFSLKYNEFILQELSPC